MCTHCTNSDKYDVVKMFLRYNVALPSSAAVESLLSVAGLIKRSKQVRFPEIMFE